MPWWLVRANETIQLRAGDGELIVSGLPRPYTAGQTIAVTFEFAYAAPVTLDVPVVASVA
jgi:copper(I)-binding protein